MRTILPAIGVEVFWKESVRVSTSCAIFCRTSAETESKHHIMIQDTLNIINSSCFVDRGTGTSRKQNIERMSKHPCFSWLDGLTF